jgi:hypothetical protein
VKLPREVLHHPRLTEGAKLLYGLLQGYAREEGICHPGLGRLAGDLGSSERTIRQRVRELETAGLIEVTQPAGGRSNRYLLVSRQAEDPVPGGQSLPAAAGSQLPPPYSEVEAVDVEGEVSTSLTSAPTSTSAAGEEEVEDELALMAGRFLVEIGYFRPSAVKLERATAVLRKLHRQGHTLEDIRLASQLAAERGARGPELIPHVIGGAVPAAREEEPSEAYLAYLRFVERRRTEWQALEERWAALSAEEQAALIARAQASNPVFARRPKDHPLVRAAAVNLLAEGKEDGGRPGSTTNHRGAVVARGPGDGEEYGGLYGRAIESMLAGTGRGRAGSAAGD